MTTIGYFCSGGYTETGSIQSFLEKINPNVRWKRCFPAVNKPALKKGRLSATPINSHNGITGQSLIDKMLYVISQPYFESEYLYDHLVLIDDLDCRFDIKSNEFNQWVADLRQSIQSTIRRKIRFDVLLASPEIEVWLVADWENSFRKEYPTVEFNLKTLLKQQLGSYWDSLEQYGGPLINGSCKNKLSTKIQDLFLDKSIYNSCILSYSKRINGVSMLSRLNPNLVERECRIVFSPTFQILSHI